MHSGTFGPEQASSETFLSTIEVEVGRRPTRGRPSHQIPVIPVQAKSQEPRRASPLISAVFRYSRTRDFHSDVTVN
jgi:hypothetical protein